MKAADFIARQGIACQTSKNGIGQVLNSFSVKAESDIDKMLPG
jgi:hypothetical protein